MPSELSDLLKLWDRSDVLDTIVAEGEAGLPDVARPATVAGLAQRVSPLLVVLPRSRDAEAFAAALGPWMAGGRVELFPAWEVLPGEAMSPTLDTMGRRLRILWELAGGGAATLPPEGALRPRITPEGTSPLHIVVTSVRAYLQQVGPPPTESLHLEAGTTIDLEDLERRLSALGYERNYLVERAGEFSVRGGILDVYPPGAHPVRADFFGDEITSLKTFSIGSQRSLVEAGPVDILPARELLLGPQVMDAARRLLNEQDAPRRRRLRCPCWPTRTRTRPTCNPKGCARAAGPTWSASPPASPSRAWRPGSGPWADPCTRRPASSPARALWSSPTPSPAAIGPPPSWPRPANGRPRSPPACLSRGKRLPVVARSSSSGRTHAPMRASTST
jgi:hypothetical protein